MTQITAEITINIPKHEVWQIISDYAGVYRFSPGIKISRPLTDKKRGVGAQRRCELVPMGTLDEQVIAWREGDSFTSAVINSKKVPPFKFAEGTLVLQDMGRQTHAHFTFNYELKFGILGKLLNAAVARSQFEKGIPQVLVGLKHHCETGEEVTPETLKALNQLAAVS